MVAESTISSSAHWLKRVASVLSDVPLSVAILWAESWALIGASLSEPHIDRTSGRFSIYYDHISLLSSLWYDRHPRAALGRTKIRKSTESSPHASFTVSLEPVAVSFDIGSLQYEFYKSSTRLRYKSAMRLRSANPGIRDG